MDDCVFCKIVNGEIPSIKLYEDDKIIVILDRFPSNIGHTLVISKKHYKDLYDVNEETYLHMMKFAKKFAKKIKKATNCGGVNILQNNEFNAGQTVFHIHIHVIPRYENDEININWKTQDLSVDELVAFADKIK